MCSKKLAFDSIQCEISSLVIMLHSGSGFPDTIQ